MASFWDWLRPGKLIRELVSGTQAAVSTTSIEDDVEIDLDKGFSILESMLQGVICGNEE